MPHDYTAIAQAIVKEYTTYGDNQSYEPVYWGQGYNPTDEEAMSLFISGEESDGFPRWREKAYIILADSVSESVCMDSKTLLDEYIKDNEPPEDFDEGELRDEICFALEEAVTQDYALEWIQNMEDPVVRVMLTDEDHPDSWVENDEDWTPERLAKNAGIEPSEKNLKACQMIIDNAYYPGTCKLLFLVFRMDASQVKDDADTVRIFGEVELWATNPFQGDGMADTVDVDLTIERSRLSTDENACGYSYDAVFGPVRSLIPRPELEFTKSKVES